MIDFLTDRMRECATELAVARGSATCTYDALAARIAEWRTWLAPRIEPGRVVSIEAEYGVESISLFLALAANRNVVVPLSTDSRAHHDAFLALAQVEHRIRPMADAVGHIVTGSAADHAYYRTLRERRHPGLVLFSSGSTGRPKAAVHDLTGLLKKFERPRHRYRTLVFLQLDHIGGVNTLLYALSNNGAVVVPVERTPARVCATVAAHRVELLPTTPTFLNLLLLSEEHLRHDLSSLRLITYGTEPMPESTLIRVAKAFPTATLQQTYGMTELGILRSKSRGPDSLWVRVGGEGYETKVVDGRLWIRAASAMLGYLNAPSPFDADGFFETGDHVEVDGEWLRILGRKSDIINVGGSKVYPAEVESVLLEMENVADAAVHGEPSPITGQMVVATVRLGREEAPAAFRTRMRLFCGERLAAYKVPVKVRFTNDPLHSTRYKRFRAPVGVHGG